MKLIPKILASKGLVFGCIFATMLRSGFLLLGFIIAFYACSDGRRSIRRDEQAVRTIKPEFAEGFVIDVLADSTYRITLLDLEHFPDTLQQVRWKAQDLENLACLSTTHIPFIKALGQLSKVKGSGFSDLIVDTDVAARVNNGEIVNLTVGHELDDEKVYGIEPDLMFVYPYGGEAYVKYLESGIGIVQISEYLERTPLGRAEWIKVFGVLLNCENKADSIFNEIRKEYLGLRTMVGEKNPERPTVFTGSFDGGNWYMPPGNSFAARLIADAGGHYLYQDSVSSKNLIFPFEKIIADAVHCDYWGKIIYEKGPLTAQMLTEGDERLASFNAFQKKQVFYCNAAETDYHGQAVLEPQRMLADLIAIFHPELIPDHRRSYFKPWMQ